MSGNGSSRINSSVCRNIIFPEIQPNSSVLSGRGFTLQQDNNPNHTTKATMEPVRSKKWNVFDWPSHSPDLNPTELHFRQGWEQKATKTSRLIKSAARKKPSVQRCVGLTDLRRKISFAHRERNMNMSALNPRLIV